MALDGLEEVKALLIRPTSEGHDLEVKLAPKGDGAYAAQMTVPLPGQWELRVHAWKGQDVFQDSRRILIP